MAFKGQIFRSLYQVTLRMYVIVGKNFCNLIGMVFLKVMYFQHFSHKMIKEIRNIIGLDIGKKSKSKANFLSCSGVFKILSVAMSQLLKISYTITKLLFETSATSSLILSPAAMEMSSFKILADLAPSWFILFSHHHHILIFRCKLFLIFFSFWNMSINATANAFASFDLFICLIIMVLSSFLQYGATTISKCFCELPLLSLLKYQNLIDLYLNSFLSLNSILSLQKTMNQRFLSILNSKKTTHTHRRKKIQTICTYVFSTVSLSVCM